jgi:Flp pilus assembly protein CpaB
MSDTIEKLFASRRQFAELPRAIRVQTLFRVRRMRRPAVFWLVTLALALLTANLVSRAAQPLPDQWGPSRQVVVLTRKIQAGQVVKPGDVGLQMVPRAFIPTRHATELSQVIGRRIDPAARVSAPIDLASANPASTSALSALIGKNQRGFAVPAEAAPAGVAVADLVDVLVNQDGDGRLLATIRSARIARVDDRQVLLSVTQTDAIQLAAALTHGRPTVIILGG